MIQLFCDKADKAQDGTLTLTGENYHHAVQVLRLREGDEISVYFDGDTSEYRYGIEEISPDAAVCRLYFVKEADTELPCEITVLQGLPKADKMETVIQKSTELGASAFIPVSCARSVVKLDEKKAAARQVRWTRIAESAAAQSHRAVIPEVAKPISFDLALESVRDAQIKLIPYELAAERGASMDRTRELIRSVSPGQRIAILIGPEGGFTEEEVDKAVDAGFEMITLGRRILRTETAAMTVLSWFVLELDDLVREEK